MANVVEKDNLTKTLRLFVILLLVVGIVTFAVTVYDLASGSSLLKLFDAKEVAVETAEETAEATTVDPNWGGQTVAYVMLAVASALLVIGGIMYFVKNSYQKEIHII